jgi:hypothetical protein
MPANKKYLATPGQRVLKITAALVGGYLVSITFHLFIMFFLSKKEVIVTMHFSSFILWATLMMVAFLAKNGWKIWGWYLLASILFASPIIYQMIVKTTA